MDEWTSKKVSLNEILQEEHENAKPLDDDLVMSKFVTESDIREYYENRLRDGKVVSNQAGGAREITIDERSLVENRPKVVIDNTFDLNQIHFCLFFESSKTFSIFFFNTIHNRF